MCLPASTPWCSLDITPSLPRPRQHSALTLPLVPVPSLAPGEYEYYDDDVDDETGSETPARNEALLAQFRALPKTTR